MSDASEELSCGAIAREDTLFGLRIGALFVVLITSSGAALFPVVAKRSRFLNLPPAAYDFVKYFGSGVIIATAFIHLLAPAWDALTNDCLQGVWKNYDWTPAIAMFSMFVLFLVEFFAFRWGIAKLEPTGAGDYGPHGHSLKENPHSEAPGLEHDRHTDQTPTKTEAATVYELDSAYSAHAQIMAVAILEFGIIFHSVIIGMTLAVDDNFKVLFVVIVFHQMFEGLGLGTRLAHLQLPSSYEWAPYAGGLAYGLTTPIGIAVGLGIRSTYNPESTTASIVSGIFDATSAGILLYTGLVELLAHEFIFNPRMLRAPTGYVVYVVSCIFLGAGIMALLGRWA